MSRDEPASPDAPGDVLTSQPRNRGGRPPRVDRAAIVRAGLEIGLERLTLREVAARVGVTPQALYNHVRDREHLVAMVGEAILEKLAIPRDDERPWKEWAYDYAIALFELLRSAPGFADVAIRRGHAMPALLESYEVMLRVATRDGFDIITAMWVTRSVNEFVQSWVSRMERQQAAELETGVDYWNDVREVIEVEGQERFPLFDAVVHEPRALDPAQRFDFALRCLIDGLAAARDGCTALAPRGDTSGR